MSAGVQRISVLNPGAGLGVKQILIRSVDAAADSVKGTDPGGVEIEVPYNIVRAGRLPSAGETWLIDRALGFWTLMAYLRPPGP